MKPYLGLVCLLFVTLSVANANEIKIEKVIKPMFLGEGPHWEPKSQTLFMVNLKDGMIVRYSPSTGTTISQKLGSDPVTFVIPVKNKPDHFVIGEKLNITLIHWDTTNNKIVSKEVLATMPDDKGNRLNDAKCDAQGRLWLGSMADDLTPESGFFYSFTKKEGLKRHLSDISVSNGLTFGLGTGKMYYIDSFKKTVDEYTFDLKTGKISNGKVLFDLTKHNIDGIPDGMTNDADGNLWVACYGANRVVKLDPTGKVLQTISFPLAHEITSVGFGGEALEDLYVTSAAERMKPEDHVKFPESGTTYRVTGLGVKGLLQYEFDLDV